MNDEARGASNDGHFRADRSPRRTGLRAGIMGRSSAGAARVVAARVAADAARGGQNIVNVVRVAREEKWVGSSREPTRAAARSSSDRVCGSGAGVAQSRCDAVAVDLPRGLGMWHVVR